MNLFQLALWAKDAAHYTINLETLCEFPHFAHDLLLGAERQPKDPNFVYADLHAHFSDRAKIADIVNEASKRVDILAITDRNPDQNSGYLNFASARIKLEKEEMPHVMIGERIAKVMLNCTPFYLVQACESYVKEGQGVVMVGRKTKCAAYAQNLADTVKSCEGSVWFLDHPFSVSAPVISFRYPTKDEMRLREKWFDDYNPIIEIGNHQNTLWMYPSNVLARKMAAKYGLVGIANSDSHFRIREVGLSRTAFPRELFFDCSEDAFFCSFRSALSSRNRERLKVESGYSSIYSFAAYMILPSLFPNVARRFDIR